MLVRFTIKKDLIELKIANYTKDYNSRAYTGNFVKPKSLYTNIDVIGRFLSRWRNIVVKKEVRGNLLDIACGDNRLVKSYSGTGKGVDIENYNSVDLVVSDLTKLPIPDKSVDTVTIIASLNYFDEPKKVLYETRRILRENGRLIITMPNSSMIRYWLKIRDPMAHRLYITREEIINLVEYTGFKLHQEKNFMLNLNKCYLFKII